ncbi:MAG: VWA domain-containing protein [Terrimicrobiaceae bacterium]|nr:VWA domain-containing protein [Terrimicrobiaceae bacterium]
MPSSIETLVSESERVRRARIRLIWTIIAIVIGLHIAAGLVAGLVVVARYIFPPPATFEVKRDIRLPAKQREHRMNMAAFDAMTPKPSFTDKMQAMRPAPISLPELPEIPLDQMLPLDPAAIVSDQVSSLVGTAGTGGGGEGSGGLGGAGTGFSFLGIQSSGRRILLLFDISQSVVTKASRSGMPLSKIKEETLALIDTLPSASRFGIIQFSQNFKPFREELVPATGSNREAVRQWVMNEWTESGTLAGRGVVSNPRGLLGVLDFAAKLQPDVVFLITDGSFQWRVNGPIENIPWKDVEAAVKAVEAASSEAKVPFNFVGFEVKTDDRRELRSLASRTGGKFREIK